MLRRLAKRIQMLDEEIADANTELNIILTRHTPNLLAVTGVGTQAAGQILTTAGENIDRLKSEASLARLCGVAPIPASSGATTRHRLHRGGDRDANSSIYLIVVNRLRWHEPTKAYVARRTQEGKTKKEIIRCLKRAVVRELYRALQVDLNQPTKALDVPARADPSVESQVPVQKTPPNNYLRTCRNVASPNVFRHARRQDYPPCRPTQRLNRCARA
jgi:hypothetical protein